MTAYSGLSNGELLSELRALAEEGRQRLADYLRDADHSDDALHGGLVFAEKLESALRPGSIWDGVWWLKGNLQKIAETRPEEEPASAEWKEFLSEHQELATAQPKVTFGHVYDEHKWSWYVPGDVDTIESQLTPAVKAATRKARGPVSARAIADNSRGSQAITRNSNRGAPSM